MKKTIAIMLFIVSGMQCFAQESSEKQELQNTIEFFFQGFHEQDSIMMKSVVYDEIILQSISGDAQGKMKLHSADFGKFLKSIVSIPAETQFQEKIHSYKIKVDGAMANVWTPYSFYIDGNLSHCGVNNFQLIKVNDEWKILYLIDTRRREGCE